jgi:hypothetical protein
LIGNCSGVDGTTDGHRKLEAGQKKEKYVLPSHLEKTPGRKGELRYHKEREECQREDCDNYVVTRLERVEGVVYAGKEVLGERFARCDADTASLD